MADDGVRETESAPSRVNTLVGRYRLLRLLGRGGMGEVYEAEHREIPRHFAVKLLRSEYAEDAQMRERFGREAKAAASLTSDHIVQVLDYDANGGSPYLAMELLEGCDLRRALKERGPLPVAEVVDIVMQACVGTEVAHRQGTVHRDLKPENLFLARRGEHYTVKVLDFGIAKLHAHGASTAAGKLLGTPAYMSPEQARGSKEVDGRTDVYALGVILYEALSGQLPHPGDGPHEIITHLLFAEPEPLERLNPQLPSVLCQLVHKALQREPAARCATVAELRSALAPFATAGYAPAALSTSEGHATLPARDSEVRSGAIPQQPPGPARGTEAGRSGRMLQMTALFTLAGTALLAAIAPWQAPPAQPPVARKAAASAGFDSARSAPSATSPLTSDVPRAPLASLSPAPTTSPATADASIAPAAAAPLPTAPRAVARPQRRSVQEPPLVPREPPAPVPATASAADTPSSEPSTFEVKHGTQTIVFKRENPLRR